MSDTVGVFGIISSNVFHMLDNSDIKQPAPVMNKVWRIAGTLIQNPSLELGLLRLHVSQRKSVISVREVDHDIER